MALLPEPIVQSIKEIAQAIQERYEIEMERIGCDQDHIHLLCSAHPKYGPGEIVRIFKSITAKQLFLRFPTLRRDLWGGEFWTDWYYVATVGERGNWGVVERYVKTQGIKPVDLQLRLL